MRQIIVPLAEISTAGVIIAVKTASDDVRPLNRIYSGLKGGEQLKTNSRITNQFPNPLA